MRITSKNLFKVGILILILAGLLSAAPSVFSQYANVDEEINDLNLKIQNQKKQLENLRSRQQEYQAQINAKVNDRINLNNQLAILENRLAKSKLDIESVNLEIDKSSLEIKKIEIDSANLDKKIDVQKKHIENLLRLVYKQDQVSALEMLLLNDSLSDFLNQIKYLENTNEEITGSVEDLKKDKEQLDQNKLSLNKKNTLRCFFNIRFF